MCAVHAKSLQPQSTLCDPMDCGPPGPSVLRTLQARILEWVAMPCSRGSSWPRVQRCIKSPVLAGRYFTSRAAWEAPSTHRDSTKYLLWMKHSPLLLHIVKNFLYLCGCCSYMLRTCLHPRKNHWPIFKLTFPCLLITCNPICIAEIHIQITSAFLVDYLFQHATT